MKIPKVKIKITHDIEIEITEISEIIKIEIAHGIEIEITEITKGGDTR